ncbi:hypothetical protein K7432_006168 [Basidiobolus ranarum]|uniref:Glutathione S-transferase n=1 Tax=Basidiobolus ranarum TaxID=34480 RepID=A0ABR2WVI1_9FUNG
MSTTDNSQYELYYFALPGRGEAIRLILEYGKANWTERSPTDWKEEKPNTPFGCLPVLFEHQKDGSVFQLGESCVIERYLARKFGLLGSNEQEAALIDSFMEGWAAIMSTMQQIRKGATEEVKEAGKINLEAALKHVTEYHEKQLIKNANGYYVGSKLSLIDIHAYTIIRLLGCFGVNHFKDSKIFDKLGETVENDPVIGAYARERLSAYKPL